MWRKTGSSCNRTTAFCISFWKSRTTRYQVSPTIEEASTHSSAASESTSCVQMLPSAEVAAMKMNSSSIPNFSLKLVRRLFLKDEMSHANWRGVKRKNKFDRVPMEFIQECVSKYTNVSKSDFEKYWQTKCFPAIDEGSRRLLRKQHEN